MLGYLKGKILIKAEDFVILNVNDVGYKLFVSENTLKKISGKKTEIELFVWPYLKRETIELYACLSQKEMQLFEIIEEMSGIGPKTALILASFGSLEKLKKALEQKSEETFQIKGIGKKKRRRLIMELTDKLLGRDKKHAFLGEKKDEALGGLLSLGFSQRDTYSALSKVSEKIKEPEKRIKKALEILSK